MVMNGSKESIKTELALLKSKGEAPDWLTWMSYAMLKSGYLDPNETPKQRYRTIADTASSYLPEDQKEWSDKFFNLIWSGFLAPSTPVMSNMGKSRGLSVSCAGSYSGDSLWDIEYGRLEVAMLSKYGFGTAVYLDVRGGYQPISTGGHTNSLTDWVESYWRTQNLVNQGGIRRGSTAIYINFWHPELLKVLPMLETHDKLHVGVICDDQVKEALEIGDNDAWNRYKTILTWRMRKGKPYILFIDNVKRQDPPQYKQLGLSSKTSNLCIEVTGHVDSDHTFSCVLSSMCADKFDQWKDTEAVFNSTVFLDCVNEDLIRQGSNLSGLERVVRYAKKSRSLGLGLLGFHTYLQNHMIPIDSFQTTRINNEVFKHLHDESKRASEFMAKWLGEPEWCLGTGLRNTHRTAIAPNTSSAMMAGAVSQGIEPFAANSFKQNLSKIGSVERVNPVLLKLLREKGKDNSEVIDSIAFNNGSIQHLDFLSDLEKQVFKTAYEINQKVLIDLAEQRQRWICHGQSLNLFFSSTEEEQWIHEVHKYAFEKDLLKSLYYVRTMAGISADKGDSCLVCEG